MKGMLALLSNLMLFMTLITLAAALASFVAYKLGRRAGPAADLKSPKAKANEPSMVQAYRPEVLKSRGVAPEMSSQQLAPRSSERVKTVVSK